MKILIALFLSLLPLFSKNIYFIQDCSNINELEAKIISQIAQTFLKEPKIFIAEAEEKISPYFSKDLSIEINCNNANFIYIKKGSQFDINSCEHKNKIIFTNDKYIFKNNEDIFGAFYWFKSRPNVKLSSKKAKSLDIEIPDDYLKFVD
jgi:hypothetical protein